MYVSGWIGRVGRGLCIFFLTNSLLRCQSPACMQKDKEDDVTSHAKLKNL
jgi:hypothetical protein